jgi:hypothetical protein
MYLEFFNEYQIQSWVKIHEIDSRFKNEYPDLEVSSRINNFSFQAYFDENNPSESYSKLKKRNAYPRNINSLERKILDSKYKLVRMKIRNIVEFFKNNISEPNVFEEYISDIEKYMQSNKMVFEKYNDEIIYYLKLFENWKKLRNL